MRCTCTVCLRLRRGERERAGGRGAGAKRRGRALRARIDHVHVRHMLCTHHPTADQRTQDTARAALEPKQESPAWSRALSGKTHVASLPSACDHSVLNRAQSRPGGRTHCSAATSAAGLGSPRPHLRRDWAHPGHICAGTGLTPPTSAPGQGSAAGSVTHEKTLARGRTARWPSASGPGGDVGGVSAVLAQMWAG